MLIEYRRLTYYKQRSLARLAISIIIQHRGGINQHAIIMRRNAKTLYNSLRYTIYGRNSSYQRRDIFFFKLIPKALIPATISSLYTSLHVSPSLSQSSSILYFILRFLLFYILRSIYYRVSFLLLIFLTIPENTRTL